MMSKKVAKEVEYFKHDSLDTTKRQIRLLRIRPHRCWQKRTSCDVEIFELSQAPAYQAVSYEWGPEHPQRNIIINGKLSSVRSNLGDFLDILRKRKDTRGHYFWIDQICIDQTNTGERNHQVQLMGAIYSDAEVVLAWLGLGPTSLLNVSIHIEATIRSHPRENKRSELCSDHRCVECSRSRRPMLNDLEARSMSRVPALFDRSYWFRLWIVQEIVLARQVVFCVDRQRITKTCLVEFLDITWLSNDWNREHIRRLLGMTRSPVSTVWSVSETLYSEGTVGTLLRCSDPRDLVYGLLGMVSDTYWLQVDYTISSEGLFGHLLEVWAMEPIDHSHGYLSGVEARLLTLSSLGTRLGVPSRWRLLLSLNEASALCPSSRFEFGVALLGRLVAFDSCKEDLHSIALGMTELESCTSIIVMSEAPPSTDQSTWSMEHIWSAMSNPELRERLIERVQLAVQEHENRIRARRARWPESYSPQL